jgi:hypothetical protein
MKSIKILGGNKDHIKRLENTITRCEEILSIQLDEIMEKFSAPLGFGAF